MIQPNKKTFIVAGLLLALAALAYWKRKPLKARLQQLFNRTPSETQGSAGSVPDSSSSSGSSTAPLDETKLLERQTPPMRGQEVAELQRLLNSELAHMKSLMQPQKKVGMLDIAREWAVNVASIQTAQVLSVDGIFGDRTEERLELLLNQSTITLRKAKPLMRHLKN